MLEITLPKILQGSLEFWIPFSWNSDFGFPVSGTGIPDSTPLVSKVLGYLSSSVPDSKTYEALSISENFPDYHSRMRR